LGRGAFGRVFLAYDPRLHREVAVKVPRLDVLADAELRGRFHREARAAAGLDHPHIVPVYEAGEVGPVCYIASAYCPGVTLAAWLKQRTEAVPYDVAATLVATLADAVQHAHSRGVLHRDLKPANILLQKVASGRQSAVSSEGQYSAVSDQSGHPSPTDYRLLPTDYSPKITDFGLAKLLDADTGAPATALGCETQTGAIVGTPSYMAPEQAGGQTKEIGPLADVYALGAIFYELLTGRPPFHAENMLDTLEQVRSHEPVPPRRLRPKLPRDLETICLKGLAKNPGRRYATARDLAEDLRHWLKGEPIAARPVGAWERGWRWARRRPALAALLGMTAVSALALVGVGVGLWYNGRLQGALTEADKLRRIADEERANAEAFEMRVRYARAMSMAYQAWQDSQIGRMSELLAEWQQNPKKPSDLLGWEWHYLDSLRHRELRTLVRGTTRFFDSVAFSPDGQWLAAPSSIKEIQIWHAASGRPVRTLVGHTADVERVAFNPQDRGQLASASRDRTVKLWDVSRGEAIHTLEDESGVLSVAFSPDGRKLASGGQDNTIKLWDVASGRKLLTCQGHADWVQSVAFSPDGRQVASGARDGTAMVWDATTGRKIWGPTELKEHANQISGVAFSPDGKTLATASADRTVKLWDTATGKEQTPPLKGHLGWAITVVFSPDGRYLASAGGDNTVKLWDTDTHQELCALRGHTDAVCGLAFHPEGHRLASAGKDGTVKLWDVTRIQPDTRQEVRILRGHTDAVRCVRFSHDGRWLASSSGNGANGVVKLWEVTSGQPIRTLTGHSSWVENVVFSPDGRLLLSASSFDQKIILWDTTKGQILRTFRGSTRAGTFTPDGRQLAWASRDGSVRLVDVATGQEIRRFTGHTAPVASTAFSPDGQILATGGNDGTVMLWDAATGALVRTLPKHSDEVNSLAFSPDGERFVSASGDILKLWLTATGEELRTFKGHTGRVRAIAFSPDGHRLVSASGDRTVKLWDIASGLEILTFKEDYWFYDVAFSPDGRRLAAATTDNTVELWEITPGDEQFRRDD
jgi:WD40 repeat protein